jgi:hydrophobic/amphiphilic exporter-1 (mainly G- bacteria), HAE1 family
LTFFQLFVRHPILTVMINLALAITGLLSYTHLNVDLLPNVDKPLITVTTTLDGASPGQIETQITRRVEDAAAEVSGIDTISSTSSMGKSHVKVRFEVGGNSEQMLQEVRDKVNTVIDDFPKNTDTPTYELHSTSEEPIMTLSVSGERSGRELTYLLDTIISKRLSAVNGVAQVQATGTSTRQIQINVDSDKLTELGLSVNDVNTALDGVGDTIPGGWMTSQYTERLVQVDNDMLSPADFGELEVRDTSITLQANPTDPKTAQYIKAEVRVKDVATIVDGVEESRSISRYNGKDTLVLSVIKTSDANLVKAAAAVKEEIENLHTMLPDDVKIGVLSDQSIYVLRSVDEMGQHLVLGGFLASLTVLIFLGSFRLMLISAVAIPVSILSTFIMMDLAGYTLNYMTLLALTLAVGLVIDDAVVVMENIWRLMEEKQMPPEEAALEGMNEISLAVLATTISLAILFLPLSLMPGEVGMYFRSWGTTLAFAICVSMFVSFSLTPMLCANFLKAPEKSEGEKGPNLATRLIQKPYEHLLHFSLKFRLVILGLCGVSVLWGGHLLGEIGKEFMATEDEGNYGLTVTMPRGWSIDRISEALVPIEEQLLALKGVDGVITTVDSSDITQVSFQIEMVPYKDRKPFTQFESRKQAQEILARYPLLTALSSDPDIQLKIQGDDPDVLKKAGEEMVAKLSATKGFRSVTSSAKGAQPSVTVRVDRVKAADLGVDPEKAGEAVQILIGGLKVSTYMEADRSYDVYLRAPSDQRSVPNDLKNIYVSSSVQGAGLIPLSQVASIVEGVEPSKIDRYDRRRVVTLEADLEKSLPQSEGLSETKAVLKSLNLPSSYGVEDTGSGELMKQTALYAFEAFVMSVILMYMVLASQFGNLLDPILILCTLPLAIPFALFSLELAGMTLNLFSVLGLFLLFGIVKKNAILQIDRTNQLLAKGVEMNEAIISANTERLRPILMTTITLVVAMIPPALVGPTGATQSPMAVVILGGQSLCLLLTLLLVPAASSYVDQLKNIRHWSIWKRFGRRKS